MRLIMPTLLLLVTATIASAQSTQPVALTSHAGLELRLQTALEHRDHQALPIMEKLVADPNCSADEKNFLAGLIKSYKDAPTTQSAIAASPASVRTPHPAPQAGKIAEMSVKELGNFDYDPVKSSVIPDDVKALSGTTMRLRGYIFPIAPKGDDCTQFMLAANEQRLAMQRDGVCIVDGSPAIQQVVFVRCPNGKALTYTPDEVIVEGKLTVAEVKDQGLVAGIFEMQTTSVRLAPK